jgi:hypothetical protein
MPVMDPDDRTFMRELLQRHDKATDAMIRRHDANSAAMIRRLDAGTEQLREHGRAMREDHREFVAEMRSQRAALFRILDRLDGGPAGAGA